MVVGVQGVIVVVVDMLLYPLFTPHCNFSSRVRAVTLFTITLTAHRGQYTVTWLRALDPLHRQLTMTRLLQTGSTSHGIFRLVGKVQNVGCCILCGHDNSCGTICSQAGPTSWCISPQPWSTCHNQNDWPHLALMISILFTPLLSSPPSICEDWSGSPGKVSSTL